MIKGKNNWSHDNCVNIICLMVKCEYNWSNKKM